MADTVKCLQWIVDGEMAHLSCHLDVELCEVAIESSLLLDLREDKGHTKAIVRGSEGRRERTETYYCFKCSEISITTRINLNSEGL